MNHQAAHNQPTNTTALRRGVHRYGFNGKEVDSEGMGGGSSTYDYGFRIFNAQLGKFLSVDPLTASYPWYTPYQFAGNKPIMAVDIDGLEDAIVINSIQVGDDGVITGGTSCTAIFSKTQNNRGGVLTVNIFSDGRTTYELIPNLSIVDEHTALNRVKNIFSDVTDVVKDFFDPEAGFYYESIDGGSLQTGRMGHGVAIKDMELVLSAISLAGNAIKAGGVKAINGESLEQMNDFIERVDDIYNVVDAWIKTNEIIYDEYIVGENYERQDCDYSIPSQPESGDSVTITYTEVYTIDFEYKGKTIKQGAMRVKTTDGVIPEDTLNQMVRNDPSTTIIKVENK